MYIRELSISNVKLLRDVKLSFMRGNDVRPWTVILAENGLCKTTLLQAIAIAASGRDLANKLANTTAYPDQRTPKKAGVIKATFGFGAGGHVRRDYPHLTDQQPIPVLISEAVILPGHQYFECNSYWDVGPSDANFNPLEKARATGANRWFVAGYGVNRNLPDPRLPQRMENRDFQRVASLFDKAAMIGTGFADIFENSNLIRKYVHELKQALLTQVELLPRIKDLDLRGRGGIRNTTDLAFGYRFSFQTGNNSVRIPATWLSQGYQATIAWIADLVGQGFLDAEDPISAAEMEGLVLIDELDLLLHPTWQVGLVKAIKKTFPRIQFVVTTHSPMVLPGLEADEIIRLRQDEHGNIQAETSTQSPALMTGSELYETFFGIDGLYPNELGDAFRRYGYLTSKPHLTDEETDEMARIREQLRAANVLPNWTPVSAETEP